MRKKNQFWKILLMVLLGACVALAATIGIVILVAYSNNKKLSVQEAEYLVPPGEMVEVNGHQIHVMHQGDTEAEHTLVFLHSNKTIDDSIVLQPLFDGLTDYDLIYVDRSGVGFSEDYDASKDIDSMLEETRSAVKAVDNNTSYILVATKSAGVEAIYWAHKYPDEVEAIVGLEMYFPDQYSEVDDDEYSGIGNKLLVKLASIGANRYATDIYPTNDFSIYTEKQMNIRNVLTSNRLYTQGMYNEDAALVKNAKQVMEYGWPEDVPMYLLYANPFMDPYLHEDSDMLDLYNEVAEQGEEYDCVTSYNDYYRTYLDAYENVTMEEISGPERLVTYNPTTIAEKIKSYIETME
jgi:pimeloyl-ACP methyl ester carboxylesterase